MTYAEERRDLINEVYDPEYRWEQSNLDEQEVQHALRKAAACLRQGAMHTFTGDELDAVRHFLPAHEVHQSMSVRFVREMFDDWGTDWPESPDPPS